MKALTLAGFLAALFVGTIKLAQFVMAAFCIALFGTGTFYIIRETFFAPKGKPKSFAA